VGERIASSWDRWHLPWCEKARGGLKDNGSGHRTRRRGGRIAQWTPHDCMSGYGAPSDMCAACEAEPVERDPVCDCGLDAYMASRGNEGATPPLEQAFIPVECESGHKGMVMLGTPMPAYCGRCGLRNVREVQL
jgi:hypothetical protein